MIEGVRNCSAIEQDSFGCDNNHVRHVLGQHAKLDFYSTTSLKQLFKVDMSSIRTHYPDFETTSILPFFVLPRVKLIPFFTVYQTRNKRDIYYTTDTLTK